MRYGIESQCDSLSTKIDWNFVQQVTGEKNQVAGCWEWGVPFVGVERSRLHARMRIAKNELCSAKRSAKTGASGSVARCEIKNAGCKAVRVVME